MTGQNVARMPEPTGDRRLLITGRELMSLTGVEDVISFDETGALLKTDMGNLALDGEELHVERLDLSAGEIVIRGRINGLIWSENKKSAKGAKRLFR